MLATVGKIFDVAFTPFTTALNRIGCPMSPVALDTMNVFKSAIGLTRHALSTLNLHSAGGKAITIIRERWFACASYGLPFGSLLTFTVRSYPMRLRGLQPRSTSRQTVS